MQFKKLQVFNELGAMNKGKRENAEAGE